MVVLLIIIKRIKQPITFLLILLLLVNVVISSSVILIAGSIKAPTITAEISFAGYNTTSFSIDTNLTITNPNSFAMTIDTFTIHTETEDGLDIATIELIGCEIKRGETILVFSQDDISFPNIPLVPLHNYITGEASLTIMGIVTKSLPFNITIITDFEDVLDTITVPTISLETDLTHIDHDALTYRGIIHITNPNSFTLSITQFNLDITDDEHNNVGHMDLVNITIPAEGHTATTVTGTLYFTALNSKTLSFSLNGIAGITLAGLNQSITFSTQIAVHIPALDELFNLDEDIQITLSLDNRLLLRGLDNKIGFSIMNPTTVPVAIDDLICSIYRVDGDTYTYLTEVNMGSCIVDPDETVELKTDVLLNYFDLLRRIDGHLLPEGVKLNIHGYIGIEGIDQRLPISVNGIFDLNIFY